MIGSHHARKAAERSVREELNKTDTHPLATAVTPSSHSNLAVPDTDWDVIETCGGSKTKKKWSGSDEEALAVDVGKKK